MEISVDRQALLRELAIAESTIQRRTTVPILSSFLLEAAEDRLTIMATDLDQSIRTSCAAKVKTHGSCTMPARKLYDYIKLLPDGDISIKLMENHWVQIRSGRSNTKMVGMDRKNFPHVPDFPAAANTQIPITPLKSMISRVIFAISDDNDRYTLNGALLILKAESLVLVATDGHRLAHIEKTGESLKGVTGAKRNIIPQKAIAKLQSLLSDTEEEFLDFCDDPSTLFFRLGHRILTARKLTGNFPNYEAVLPRDNNKRVVVLGEDLMRSIQRVAMFADDRSNVRLCLEQNHIKISSSSADSGESEDTIDTPYNFDAITIGFKSTYLIDFLKTIRPAGEVRFELKDVNSACQMFPEDADDDLKYRYVLMPMRV